MKEKQKRQNYRVLNYKRWPEETANLIWKKSDANILGLKTNCKREKF